MAKSQEFPVINSSSRIISSEKFLFSFLSDQAYVAIWHQCCLCLRQSTKKKQQNSENTYNYY